MTYHVAKSDKCPINTPWAVVKDGDGKVLRCHVDRESAQDDMDGLMENDPAGAMTALSADPEWFAERGPKPYGNETYADPKNGKYPLTKNGKLDSKRIHAAWSYINQADNAAKYPLNGVTLGAVKARIKAAAKKIGMEIQAGSGGGGNSADPAGEDRDAGVFTRAVPFEATRTGDGLTLEGYAAVFNRKALIKDYQGDFEEQIAPGAFRESLEKRTPVLMFEHGKHPLIGSMPLGRIDDAHEDQRGLFISARLSDNWLIQPVRDAVRDGAVTGMSFRFGDPGEDGQRWEKRSGRPDLRTLLRLDAPELGPVVFPAYEPTTAAVRSLLDGLDEDFTGRERAERPGGGRYDDVQPGNGGPSPNHRTVLRDRAWRIRRQLT
jgi:HK97 family phage prohead protease